MPRESFREIQNLLGLEQGPDGAGGSVYRDEVKAVAERIGIPYKQRTKTWRGVLRSLGVQPLPQHTSTGGTITDQGFDAVRDRLNQIKASHGGDLPIPVVDFLERPVHLVLRWDPSLDPDTVQEHRSVAEAHGSAWWGKLGQPNRAALSAVNLAKLREQLGSQIPTHVYLYRPGELWRTRLLQVETDSAGIEPVLVPAYNSGGHHHLWLRLAEFELLPPGWAGENLIFASTAEPVVFNGQNSIFVVKLAAQAAEHPERYFIFNHGSDEDQEHYSDQLGERLGFDANVTGRVPLLEAQHGRFIYYQTSNDPDHPHPQCFIGAGGITSVESEPPLHGLSRWVANLTDYTEFPNPVPRSAYEPAGWNIQHGIAEITADTYQQIVERGMATEPPMEFTTAAVMQAGLDANLKLDDEVYRTVVSALKSGKHVILTGPPGTAKTTLAEVVARAAVRSQLADGYALTTATADWTTYETIGGLRPAVEGAGLEFRPGHFLAAAGSGRWLVIDELNRSNFDRAFGQLFTLLSGQSIVLPYEDRISSKPIAVVLGDQVETYPDVEYSVIHVPPTWRIIATMNVFDKSLLFEMSFALMRRFAFVEVPAPVSEVYRQLWEAELDGLEDDTAGTVSAMLWRLLRVRKVKEVGPASYIDMARFAVQYVADCEGKSWGPGLTFQLFYSYLLPQFEGVDRRHGQRLFDTVAPLVDPVHRTRLRNVLNEVLGLHITATQPFIDLNGPVDLASQPEGQNEEDLEDEWVGDLPPASL